MNETITPKGHINFKLHGPDGKLKQELSIANVVVTAGKNFLATWLAAASQAGAFMPYIAVGTGTTGAASGDVDLQSALGSRVAGTVTSSLNVWQNVAVFGAGVSTGAISEAGIFSASTSGTMLAHQVFAAINKAAGDSLTITWNITLS